MGEITRRGYRIEWFIGDHGPRHVYVYDAKERFLGRLDIERMRGIEGWMPSKKFRSHFKVEYDTGEIAEVSWSFVRELPPKYSRK